MSFTEPEEYAYRAANDRSDINSKKAQDNWDFWGVVLLSGGALLILGLAWLFGAI